MNFTDYFVNIYVPRLVEFISAPVNFPNMLWMTIPLIVIFLTMELYFSRYKYDELGWNSAVTNSMVLIFIFLDLIRFLYTNYGWDMIYQESLVYTLPLVLFIGTLGLFLTVVTFFREIPKSLAFFFASPLTINYLAYFAIVMTYTTIPFNMHTIFAAITLYIFMLAFFWAVKVLFPEAKIAENLPDFKDPLPFLD